MVRSLVSLAVLAVLACQPMEPAPQITGTNLDITTDRARYGTADSATVTVRNISSQSVRFNLCPGALERWNGSSWQTVDRPDRELLARSMEPRSCPARPSLPDSSSRPRPPRDHTASNSTVSTCSIPASGSKTR